MVGWVKISWCVGQTALSSGVGAVGRWKTSVSDVMFCGLDEPAFVGEDNDSGAVAKVELGEAGKTSWRGASSA